MMTQQPMKLIFLEEWLGFSALTDLHGKELTAEIQRMEKMANVLCKNGTLEMLSAKHVPIQETRELIIRILHSIRISIIWNAYVDDFNYPHGEKTYQNLGYVLFRIQFSQDNTHGIKKTDIRPEHLQQIIFVLAKGLQKTLGNRFLFDTKTVPYAVTVCSGLEGSPEIEWYNKTISEHKHEIGKWVELYSGQFSDYHDELYERRIRTNLSNRTSEMHFLNRNSGLIYMKPENYDAYFITEERTKNSTGYMYDVLLKTIFQIRTIAFAMILVTGEIDKDTLQLTTKSFIEKDSTVIKEDLDRTKRLKMILQKTLAPFQTDLSRSHRQHYHAILKHSVEINDIEKIWVTITTKLESNVESLNSIFLDKQEDANKRQEKKLAWVNGLLGASIVFEILSFLIDDPILLSLVKKIVGGVFLVFILGILVLPKFFKKKK
ncbi:MAG: hypothetical protein ACTSWW_03995 [Promethearchaeota archaeon]